MVVKELAKVAFLDIKELFNEYGGLKNINEIEGDARGAISSIESFEEFEGFGEDREQIGEVKKIKLLDKIKALELLGKHLGMFNDKVKVTGTVNTYDVSKMTDEQLNKLLEKVEKNE